MNESQKNYKKWRNRVGVFAFTGMFEIIALFFKPALIDNQLFLIASFVDAILLVVAIVMMASYDDALLAYQRGIKTKGGGIDE